MPQTIVGIFPNKTQAEKTISLLKDEDYNPKRFSVIMKDRESSEQMAEDTGTSVASGAISGVGTGAVIGGLIGLLAPMVIPGIGAFLIGGPLATALGLTGTTASVVSGVATGAVAGGILGALTSFGLSESEAKDYEERINQGDVFLAVPANPGEEFLVRQIFAENGGEQIQSIDMYESGSEKSRVRSAQSVAFANYIPENEQKSKRSPGVKGHESSSKSPRMKK